jgi:hypothetical protein
MPDPASNDPARMDPAAADDAAKELATMAIMQPGLTDVQMDACRGGAAALEKLPAVLAKVGDPQGVERLQRIETAVRTYRKAMMSAPLDSTRQEISGARRALWGSLGPDPDEVPHG